MLNQLVDLLENKANGLSLSEISRAINAQPSAVLSMLNLLVQKGKLIEIGPDGKYCALCGLQSGCSLLAARGKRYAVAPHSLSSSMSSLSARPGITLPGASIHITERRAE